MSRPFVLRLLSPSTLSLRQTLSSSRLRLTKGSKKHATKEELHGADWPVTLQRVGYALLFAFPAIAVTTAIVERRDFRALLEGDEGGEGGFGLGKSYVAAVRKWWTDGRGFKDEDYAAIMYSRSLVEARKEEDLGARGGEVVTVISESGVERSTHLKNFDKDLLHKELRGAKEVYFEDKAAAQTAGDNEYVEAVDAPMRKLVETDDLLGLTHTFSSWSDLPVTNKSSSSSTSSTTKKQPPQLQKPQQPKSNLEELKAKAAQITAEINNPNNTRDMDTLFAELEAVKIEIRKERGIMGWFF